MLSVSGSFPPEVRVSSSIWVWMSRASLWAWSRAAVALAICWGSVFSILSKGGGEAEEEPGVGVGDGGGLVEFDDLYAVGGGAECDVFFGPFGVPGGVPAGGEGVGRWGDCGGVGGEGRGEGEGGGVVEEADGDGDGLFEGEVLAGVAALILEFDGGGLEDPEEEADDVGVLDERGGVPVEIEGGLAGGACGAGVEGDVEDVGGGGGVFP